MPHKREIQPMGDFDIASRFDFPDDRCPRCSFTYQNFMLIKPGILACFKCGTPFIDKATRTEQHKQAKSKLEKKLGMKKPKAFTPQEGTVHICPVADCKKICKNKVGLYAHIRLVHPDMKENDSTSRTDKQI